MNYIVFDMEWNQPYPGERLLYRNNLCLNNEIIQIGAVKLDEKADIVDTYSVNIKPSVIKKLNHNVKKLTGIDESILNKAASFGEVIEDFKKWCGSDFVFITWGYDDMGVLGSNLKYFSLDTSWLPECYNLQMIFCAQTDNENRQYSLSYAADYFQIVTDKPLHNALTDAYYTALVCKKLDLSKGISKYHAMVFKDKSIPEHMKNIVYKRTHPGASSYSEIVSKCGLSRPCCYKCSSELEVCDKANNGIFQHLLICKCASHGEFALSYRINKNSDAAFNATEQCFVLDKYNKPYFKQRLKKMRQSEEKRSKNAEKLNKIPKSTKSFGVESKPHSAKLRVKQT